MDTQRNRGRNTHRDGKWGETEREKEGVLLYVSLAIRKRESRRLLVLWFGFGSTWERTEKGLITRC